MKKRIAEETDNEMRTAYQEMLESCISHPEQKSWYAVWFIELNGKRIEAETDKDNKASQRVLEKTGFVPSGEIGEEEPRLVWGRKRG